jgi:hypothetical protein
MKKLIFIFIVILSVNNIIYSQNIDKIKQAKEIHWYGLDFTKAKMIGSIGFTHPDIICDRYIKNKWNGIMFAESEKYDVNKVTKGKNVKIHLDYILKRNSVITTENLIINENYEITEVDVQELINAYPNDTGLGLVFIVESFNKLQETANIWVTFFDTNSKEILKTKKYSTEGGGFGVLNFWLGGVYDTFKELKKDYKKW